MAFDSSKPAIWTTHVHVITGLASLTEQESLV